MTTLTAEQRKQGATLHNRDVSGERLTDAERELMQRFRATLEAEESEQRREANARQEELLRFKRNRNEEMERLVARQTALAERLRALLGR